MESPRNLFVGSDEGGEVRTGDKKTEDFSTTLETLFTNAVGLSKKSENGTKEAKKLSNLFKGSGETGEIRTGDKKAEDLMEIKELSDDMAVFAKYLHKKGYLKDANCLRNNVFDASCFVNSYGRDFLKFAAERFAMDHREIYKWLPTADLKTVAQFGCPSLGRKNVFSAKAMRFCYGIQEETVCNKCVLKESCKFVNQSVWKKGAKNMDLAVVMRVITLYALDAVPSQLEVTTDVKNAVSRLLQEIIRLDEIES
ncbi:hypothetical protein CTI12_AA071780 [Artemisia annua]|uniref:Uncharacterized protein n=1 Tax=Artemisia annua TaxID=35608 RepID=A0A2U1Q5Q9_ARTAN|nr:hypothetical protein CTI12_AA071780 [Artemisia annua]